MHLGTVSVYIIILFLQLFGLSSIFIALVGTNNNNSVDTLNGSQDEVTGQTEEDSPSQDVDSHFL